MNTPRVSIQLVSAFVPTRLLHSARPGGWALRGGLVLGVLLSLLAGVPAGYRPPVFLVVVVLLVAVLAAFFPEGLSLSVAMVAVVAWWTLQLHGELPAAIVLAAAGLVVAHVAATLLAYGPPSLSVDPRLALLWAARGALAWLAALAVWTVARAYSGHGTPTLFWLTGLAAAIGASVVAGVSLPARGESAGDEAVPHGDGGGGPP